MKVRYTPDVFRFQRAGGVSRYFVELARGLGSMGVDAKVIGGLHISDLLGSVRGSVGLNVGRLRPERARQATTKGVDYVLTAAIIESLGRGDVLHPTWYPPRLEGLPKRAHLVVTVFDMIHERYPDLSIGSDGTSRWKRAWVQRADHVIVISEQTRRDLVECFSVPPDKVSVTHLAPITVEADGELLARCARSRPFLLYVGDRRPAYKNFGRLLDALAAPPVPRDVALLCVGDPTPSAEELSRITMLGLEARVAFVSATDAELAAYYHGASALVYPSLYEGFGLPPLEAMTSGCPVIAAEAASIPEVVGDAALLVPPTDVHALANAIAEVLEPSTRTRLVEAGLRRSASFSWQSTVERTLDVYRLVVESGA